MVCLETAQPTKFADTIREALGRDPELPAAYVDIEDRPLRFETMDADAAAINDFAIGKTRIPATLIKKATSLRFAKPPVYRCRALSPS